MSLQWNCAIAIKQGRLTTQLVNAMKRHGGDVIGGNLNDICIKLKLNISRKMNAAATQQENQEGQQVQWSVRLSKPSKHSFLC